MSISFINQMDFTLIEESFVAGDSGWIFDQMWSGYAELRATINQSEILWNLL